MLEFFKGGVFPRLERGVDLALLRILSEYFL